MLARQERFQRDNASIWGRHEARTEYSDSWYRIYKHFLQFTRQVYTTSNRARSVSRLLETVVGGRKGALHVPAGEKGISISSIWQFHDGETDDVVNKDSGTTTLMFFQKEFLVSFLPLRW